MDIAKKFDRATLKSYFATNAVPTESNFTDLIDNAVNPKEDGIVKLANEPLSVQAAADDPSGQKRALSFYYALSDAKPAWTLSLTPRADAANPQSAKAGWSIGDAGGASRLFIDQTSGNVGIGTVEPGTHKLNVRGPAMVGGSLYVISQNEGAGGGALRLGPDNQSNLRLGYDAAYSWIQSHGSKPLALNPLGNNVGIGRTDPVSNLDIAQAGRTNPENHPKAVKGLYVTGDFGESSDGVEFRHTNGSQGIGFGFNTIYATGSNTTQDLSLKPKGGTVRVKGGFAVESAQAVSGIPVVDFQTQTQSFERHSGSAKTLTYTFKFARPVTKAEPMLKGWWLAYGNRELVKEAGVACGNAVIDGSTVTVTVTFSLRDLSGTFDDPYWGNATVVVIAHLSQTL